MAPRGSKRAAAQLAEEPEAKRVATFLKEQGVTKASYQPVLEAMEHPHARLTEDERRVVLAVLPWSLLVPANMRNEAQAAAVSMVDKVVVAVRAALQEAADVEARQVDHLEASRLALEATVQHTAAAELEARQAEEECRGMLKEADAMVEQKRIPLRVAELEGKRLGDELEHARAQKTQLEDAYFRSFARLREGSFEDSEVEGLVESVLAGATMICLEESLLVALPGALAKRGRGSFDVAVVHQAEQALCSKVAALGEVAQASQAPFAAQASIVQAVQADFDAAAAAQRQAAEGLREAQEGSTAATAAAKSATEVVTELGAKLAPAAAAKRETSAELHQFCVYNVFMFKLLRDRQSSKGSETQAVEAAGEEASADVPSKLAEPQQVAECPGEGLPMDAPGRPVEALPTTEVPAEETPSNAPSEATDSEPAADLASEEMPTAALSEADVVGEEVPVGALGELAGPQLVGDVVGEDVSTDLSSKVSVKSHVGDMSVSLAGA